MHFCWDVTNCIQIFCWRFQANITIRTQYTAIFHEVGFQLCNLESTTYSTVTDWCSFILASACSFMVSHVLLNVVLSSMQNYEWCVYFPIPILNAAWSKEISGEEVDRGWTCGIICGSVIRKSDRICSSLLFCVEYISSNDWIDGIIHKAGYGIPEFSALPLNSVYN